MAEFFYLYYDCLNVGLGFVLRDIVYSVGLVIVLTEINRSSVKSILLLLAKMVGTYGVLILCESFMYMFMGPRSIILVSYPLTLAVYAVTMCRYRVISRIALSACFYTISIYAIHSVDLLFTIINGTESFNPSNHAWLLEGLRVAAYFALTAVVCFYLCKCTPERYKYINRSGVVVLLGFMLLNIVLPDYAECGTVWENFITNTILWVLQLLVYYLFYSATKEHNIRLETKMMLERRAAQEEMLHLAYKNREDLLEIRHEIKNQYLFMREMIETGQYENLKKFFGGFEDRVQEAFKFPDCGNNVVNAILTTEINNAAYYGFRLEYKIAVPPELAIKDVDLCSALSNPIDNAIEYCSKAGFAPEDVAIGVTIRLNNKSLIIRITNPIKQEDEAKALALKTTKNKAFLHGWGTRILNRITEDYNGCVNYNVNDGEFVVDILLTLLEGKPEGDAV